jgi:8-oxo-(d)GTP phosphatase
MKLYINDKLLHFLAEGGPDEAQIHPDSTLRSLANAPLDSIRGVVHLTEATEEDVSQIINWIEFRKVPALQSVLFSSPRVEELKTYVKSMFRIIEAAGGLVMKDDRYLLIYRLGKWDLPKGKLEKGEKARVAAVREVEEECGVEAELIHKLCTTWHTYMQEGKRILKKTKWYTMHCLNDENMEPQYVEGIEDIRWMTLPESEIALEGSYRSIREVIASWKSIQGPVGV